jgi:hypothetical protein
MREEDYVSYQRCTTAYPAGDDIPETGEFRYGQIQHFARITLGDGSVLEMANVVMFGETRPDGKHQLPTFSPRTCPHVKWIGVRHIGLQVIIEATTGLAADRRRGPLVALGGSRTWEPHEYGGAAAALPPIRRLEPDATDTDSDTDSDSDEDPAYEYALD